MVVFGVGKRDQHCYIFLRDETTLQIKRRHDGDKSLTLAMCSVICNAMRCTTLQCKETLKAEIPNDENETNENLRLFSSPATHSQKMKTNNDACSSLTQQPKRLREHTTGGDQVDPGLRRRRTSSRGGALHRVEGDRLGAVRDGQQPEPTGRLRSVHQGMASSAPAPAASAASAATRRGRRGGILLFVSR